MMQMKRQSTVLVLATLIIWCTGCMTSRTTNVNARFEMAFIPMEMRVEDANRETKLVFMIERSLERKRDYMLLVRSDGGRPAYGVRIKISRRDEVVYEGPIFGEPIDSSALRPLALPPPLAFLDEAYLFQIRLNTPVVTDVPDGMPAWPGVGWPEEESDRLYISAFGYMAIK